MNIVEVMHNETMAPSTGVGRTQVQERKSTYTYESVPSAPWMRPKFRPT